MNAHKNDYFTMLRRKNRRIPGVITQEYVYLTHNMDMDITNFLYKCIKKINAYVHNLIFLRQITITLRLHIQMCRLIMNN